MIRYSTNDSASAANTSRMECCLTNTVAAQIAAAMMTAGMRTFFKYLLSNVTASTAIQPTTCILGRTFVGVSAE